MKHGRKITGGKYKKQNKRKSYERAGQKLDVKLGEEKRKTTRVMGGNRKSRMLKVKFINVEDGKSKKRVEIKNVLETPSNRFLARQNIVTRGTIVETELGKVRVTNRPGQEGAISGIVVEEKK